MARGTLNPFAVAQKTHRFIPAGAGNSVRRGGSTTVFSVYPRWRGELEHVRKYLDKRGGLSPLARGTPFLSG